MSKPPRIALLPTTLKLGWRPSRIPLEALDWPLGRPEGTEGQTLGDLNARDHLIVPPRKSHYLRPGFGTRAKVSILVMEPSVIHGHHMQRLKRAHGRFHKVLTSNEDLLSAVPNGLFFAHGGTWVPEWRDLDLSKTKTCSLIASKKASQDGHRLRHQIVARAREEGLDVDALGEAYAPFDAKAEGLAPYRFSVVIENVRERNYFTEKLIDAVLCRCVPIYWGCPNIGDFLDTSGLIQCDSAEAVAAAVRGMSEELYAAHLPGVEAIRERAAHWGDYPRRAAEAVLAAEG